MPINAFTHPEQMSFSEQCELAQDLGFSHWSAERTVQRLLDAMRPDDKADWFAEVRHWLDQGCSYDEIAGWLPEADASDDAWNLDRGIQ